VTTINSSIQTWQSNARSAVAAVAISADGETIVAGTLGKTVLCLDEAGHQRWQARVGNQAWRVALSANGQITVVGTGSTRPWDLGGRGLFCFGDDGSQRWQTDLEASIWGLALSADGNTIAAGTDAKQLLLFDGQGHRLWQQDVPGLGWYAWVWSAALSADGSLVAAGSADKRVRLLERGGLILAEYHTQGDVFAITISDDGTTVAAGDTNGHIHVLDRQGHPLWKEQLADKIWAVVLSADGARLLVGAGEKEAHLRMYDRAGRLIWRRYVGGSISSVALSEDGRRSIAGTRDGGIFIFDEDGEVLHQARAGKIVRDVAISSAGERAIAGSEDGMVYGFRLPRSAVQPRPILERGRSKIFTPPIDFVIITPLDEEREALLSKLNQPMRLPPSDDDSNVYYAAQIPVTFPDGTTGTYRVVVTSLLNMGRAEATTVTKAAIRTWHPRYVLLVGIAGGVRKETQHLDGVRLGDILIADQMVDYELQKLTAGKDAEGASRETHREIRWRVHPADAMLLGAARHLTADRWHQLIQVPRPQDGAPTVHIGTIVSGDKVIAVEDVLTKYREVWPQLIGVEMEGGGVATAAFRQPRPPGFFMVRGASDFADSDKGTSSVESWRAYACDVAAAYAIGLLQSGPIAET